MLRYSCFSRMYKGLFYCWVESGAFNLGICPQAMHTSAAVHAEYESQEETALCGPRNVHRSAEKDSEAMTKLHIPVMVDEVIHCLTPRKGQVFLDMTFGAGGHTKAILQKEPDITVYALDRDPTAYAIAKQLSQVYPKQVQALLGQFSEAEALLIKAGVQPGTVDGVLLDLGCSSMQLDAPERGFSLRKDGPLDMRMDGDRYPDMPTAADVVNALDQQALASILRAYGEEKHAKKIASAIIQARSIYPISRTQQLASVVADPLPICSQVLGHQSSVKDGFHKVFRNDIWTGLAILLSTCVADSHLHGIVPKTTSHLAIESEAAFVNLDYKGLNHSGVSCFYTRDECEKEIFAEYKI